MTETETETFISGYTDIRGGVTNITYRDRHGDEWTSTRQLAFLKDGVMTPLGRLVDYMNLVNPHTGRPMNWLDRAGFGPNRIPNRF